MNKNNLFDLTPLLDVILILLFAILINGNFERTAESADYEDTLQKIESTRIEETNRLSQQIIVLNKTVEDYEALIDSPLNSNDLKKYTALSGLVRVMDVRLETQENLIFIDGLSTNLYILYGDLTTPQQITAQKERIRTLFLDQLRKTPGMVLITLEEDGQVYRYAYQLVHNVILELIQTQGSDKLYYMQLN